MATKGKSRWVATVFGVGGLTLLCASEGAAQPAAAPPPEGPPLPTASTALPPPPAPPPPAPAPAAVPPQGAPAPPAQPGAYPYGGQRYGAPYYGPPYGGAWAPAPPPYDQPPGMPATLPYQEGREPPPGYVLESRSIRGLWLAGTISLGSCWFLSAMSAGILYDDEGEDIAPLFVPVVGPFVAIGTLSTRSSGTTLLVLDGVGQAGGLAMLIAGLTAERKIWVRDYFSVSAAPVVSATGSGLSLLGEM